jgi:hypothetical protein
MTFYSNWTTTLAPVRERSYSKGRWCNKETIIFPIALRLVGLAPGQRECSGHRSADPPSCGVSNGSGAECPLVHGRYLHSNSGKEMSSGGLEIFLLGGFSASDAMSHTGQFVGKGKPTGVL